MSANAMSERDALLVDLLSTAVGRGHEQERWIQGARLGPDLQLDSLDMLELILVAEDQVGREFPAELLETIETVGDLLEWMHVAWPEEES